ncbi:helix-turn-helix transcriptional regulator [Prauserella cavernicola]|uniref:Helix-turn-helix domain-containing protein n=1 Tax=Prauserella cavernicola TaxID=2800127 RepID=A0A934QNK0_9PSEU|nr:AraC family transcriptional regulator [Prauserella cavernicola]MBK1783166.1 helix-turn-helix domain-containing protein [Prauserella cavernicola]
MTAADTYGAVVEHVPEHHRMRFAGHDTHSHDEPHLIWVVSGRGRVTTPAGVYVLPSGTGLWLAARVPHAMSWDEPGFAGGFLLHESATPVAGAAVIDDARVAESVAAVLVAAPGSDTDRAPFRALLADALARTEPTAFALPRPAHPVAATIADALLAGEAATLETLALGHHLSPRHVQRLFLDETGLTFRQWRSRARLNRALAELRSGATVTRAAQRSGYRTRQGLVKALRREGGPALG